MERFTQKFRQMNVSSAGCGKGSLCKRAVQRWLYFENLGQHKYKHYKIMKTSSLFTKTAQKTTVHTTKNKN